MAESAPEMSFDMTAEVSTDAAAPLWANKLKGQFTQTSRPSTHLPAGAEAMLNQLLAVNLRTFRRLSLDNCGTEEDLKHDVSLAGSAHVRRPDVRCVHTAVTQDTFIIMTGFNFLGELTL